MTWFFNVSKKSMIGLPASVGVHLYFLLQADIKELAYLEIHFNVLNMYLFSQMNRSKQRKTTSERTCVCLSDG